MRSSVLLLSTSEWTEKEQKITKCYSMYDFNGTAVMRWRPLLRKAMQILGLCPTLSLMTQPHTSPSHTAPTLGALQPQEGALTPRIAAPHYTTLEGTAAPGERKSHAPHARWIGARLSRISAVQSVVKSWWRQWCNSCPENSYWIASVTKLGRRIRPLKSCKNAFPFPMGIYFQTELVLTSWGVVTKRQSDTLLNT